jgi:hypothetical protein
MNQYYTPAFSSVPTPFFSTRSLIARLPSQFPCKKYATAFNSNQGDAYENFLVDASLSDISSKFTVKVCTSSTCSNRRRSLGQEDSFFITNLCERREYSGLKGLNIEETNCLGQCKKGPCVAVEHDDYEGSVALEGMLPMEFNRRW